MAVSQSKSYSGADLSSRELAAWRGMLRTHSATIARLDQELISEHDLALSSYEVLLYLAAAPENSLRMGELADQLYLSRSGLTRLIDRLARAGLVERVKCGSDRRGSFAKLTEAGRERFEQARPTHLRGVREHFLARLEDDDLGHLAAAWERVSPGGPELEPPAAG